MDNMQLLQGNSAIVEAALLSNCRFFAGYPITPSSEIMNRCSIRMPELGGTFIQMEDELASINAVIGASWAGVRALTATSGPGLDLMQESISLAAMTETPCVIVDVQRGGPSTGTPTLPSQSDILSVKYGGHGDYEVIAMTPWSVQEAFDMTVKVFNLSDKYRVPAFILTEETLAHMREQMTIPFEVEVIERKEPTKEEAKYPYRAGEDLVPPMPTFGKGYRAHISGLAHDEKGYPLISSIDGYEKLVRRLSNKVLRDVDILFEYEADMVEESDMVLVAYGSTARAAHNAFEMARADGLSVGFLRLKTLWPFNFERFHELVKGKKMLVVEMNLGKLFTLVRYMAEHAALSSKLGEMPHPEEIVKDLKEFSKLKQGEK